MDSKWHPVTSSSVTTCNQTPEGEKKKRRLDRGCCSWWREVSSRMYPHRCESETRGQKAEIRKLPNWLQNWVPKSEWLCENLKKDRNLLQLPATKTEWWVRKDLAIEVFLIGWPTVCLGLSWFQHSESCTQGNLTDLGKHRWLITLFL